MSKKRIAVLGLHHDHIWSNLEELAALENGELVAAADFNPPLLQKVKELYPACETFEDSEAMLDAVEPDAVYAFGSNRLSADETVTSGKQSAGNGSCSADATW